MISKQEMFDKLYEHFVVTMAPRSTLDDEPATYCVYNGDNGAHCAIGLFITDLQFTPDYNASGIDVLLDNHPEIAKRFEGLDSHFLRRVQRDLHDKLSSVQSERHAAYKYFARAHHLTMPPSAERMEALFEAEAR